MYHVSAQGVDERVLNVHYYYFTESQRETDWGGGGDIFYRSLGWVVF